MFLTAACGTAAILVASRPAAIVSDCLSPATAARVTAAALHTHQRTTNPSAAALSECLSHVNTWHIRAHNTAWIPKLQGMRIQQCHANRPFAVGLITSPKRAWLRMFRKTCPLRHFRMPVLCTAPILLRGRSFVPCILSQVSVAASLACHRGASNVHRPLPLPHTAYHMLQHAPLSIQMVNQCAGA